MKVKVIGIQNVDFTLESGNAISGLKYYVEVLKEVEYIQGHAVQSVFVGENVLKRFSVRPVVGDVAIFDFERNQSGKAILSDIYPSK